ncbi:unnamed protein product [Musa hybrid cultivar]
MALEKDRIWEGSQACPLYGGEASIQRLNPPSLGHMMIGEGEGSDFNGSSWSSLLPFLSDPKNSFSSTYTLEAVDALPQEALSILDCNATTSEHWAYSNASVLCFDKGGRMPRAGPPSLDHDDDCAAWIDAMDQNCQLSDLDIKCPTADSTLIHEQDCFAVENWCAVVGTPEKDKRQCQDRFGLIYPGAAAVDGLRESIGRATVLQKRPYTDASDRPSPKKQCRGNTGRTKDKSSPSKDPQSTAAKNRRERISERLKILQDLVPNGTKVDLVTMLEKAISYVKFLQLQVKVLATDEFWPAQGVKAPDVGKVKEALDAILSSHRDGSSSSKNAIRTFESAC